MSPSPSALKTLPRALRERLFPALALLFLVTGCTSPQRSMRAGQAGAVATIRVYVPNLIETAIGNEIRCQIRSIDGIDANPGHGLSPGKHRLIATLHSQGKDYLADVDLIIPAAKDYRLKAERKEDAFTLELYEVDTSRTVATSTAPANQQMKFVVFVIQK